MPKVKCAVCEHEDSSFCKVKKCKIKVNKSRTCSIFKFVPEKVRIKRALPVTRVSAANVVNKPSTKRREYVSSERNTEHPLTGDLSRFTTTASKGDR